jgi:hypothetical protein
LFAAVANDRRGELVDHVHSPIEHPHGTLERLTCFCAPDSFIAFAAASRSFVDTLENVVIVREHLGKMLFAPRLVADHATIQSKLLPLCLHKEPPVRAFGLIRELLGGLLTTALPTIHETLQRPRVSLAGLIRKPLLCAPGSGVPALAPIENAVQ